MDELQNPPAHTEDTNEKIETLRSQMNLLFGCILVASLTLTAYLAVQARRSSLEALALKRAAGNYAVQMQQENAIVSATLSKLVEFTRTHPDFQKIVHINTNAPPAMPPAPVKK